MCELLPGCRRGEQWRAQPPLLLRPIAPTHAGMPAWDPVARVPSPSAMAYTRLLSARLRRPAPSAILSTHPMVLLRACSRSRASVMRSAPSAVANSMATRYARAPATGPHMALAVWVRSKGFVVGQCRRRGLVLGHARNGAGGVTPTRRFQARNRLRWRTSCAVGETQHRVPPRLRNRTCVLQVRIYARPTPTPKPLPIPFVLSGLDRIVTCVYQSKLRGGGAEASVGSALGRRLVDGRKQ